MLKQSLGFFEGPDSPEGLKSSLRRTHLRSSSTASSQHSDILSRCKLLSLLFWCCPSSCADALCDVKPFATFEMLPCWKSVQTAQLQGLRQVTCVHQAGCLGIAALSLTTNMMTHMPFVSVSNVGLMCREHKL